MRKLFRLGHRVSQRKLIEPQHFTLQPFEDRFKVSSQNYEFVINKKPPSELIYTHEPSIPAAVLKKPAIHILPESLPEINKREKIAAVTRQFESQYQDAFKKCHSPKDIFHLERRIKFEIRNRLSFIGCLSSKYKHLLCFTPYFQVMAQNTQKEYEKQGVKVELLEATIFPKGKVWLPTSQRYLSQFAALIKDLPCTSSPQSPQRQVSALDLGCGSGVLSFVFAKTHKKSRVFGLDSNPAAVQTTNLNAASLKLDNVSAFQFDVLEQEQFELKTMAQRLPRHFDCVFINPPWVPASKLEGESVIADGVFDRNCSMLSSSLRLAKRVLAKQGRVVVVYSDLGQLLGLSSHSMESISSQVGLVVEQKQEQPLYEQMPKKSALMEFKSKAKILTYLLKHQ